MLEERTIHLINADLDGELGTEESGELEAILESSAEARAMRAELLKLNNLLDSLPQQAPPPDLLSRIVDRLTPPAKASNFSWHGLFAGFKPATAGLAFAAGLLLTVGFYELSPNRQSSGDTASMVGTMVASQSGSRHILKNDLFLKGDGFSGTVSLRVNEGIHVLSFDLDSEKGTEIEVGLDRTGLSFGGFAETRGDAEKIFESVSISGGALRVFNQGRQQFAVYLHENSPEQDVDTGSITIGFSTDGDPLQEGTPELQ